MEPILPNLRKAELKFCQHLFVTFSFLENTSIVVGSRKAKPDAYRITSKQILFISDDLSNL